VQEEIRCNNQNGISSKEKEEDVALVKKGKKDKGNKSQGEEVKKKYLSNIKCFHCHEFAY